MSLRRRLPRLAAGLLLAAAAAGLYAQPFDPVEDRRRAVGDWLVEHIGEEDGGRLVRMTREGDDHNIEYRIGFWHGNPGPVLGGTVMRLNGMCGGYESPADGNAAVAAATVRAELAGHLAQCGVDEARAAATLEGFERAYTILLSWVEEAAAAAAAEGQAIADYGADMGASDTMDMGADATMTDTNITNMDYGGEPEPDPERDPETTEAGDPN